MIEEWTWEVENDEVVRVLRLKPERRSYNKTPYSHGDYRMYFIKGCRCEPCRKAATEYSRNLRHAHKVNPPKNIVHGRATTYKHFGCRCKPCGMAMREYQRGYTESAEAKARRNERKREKRRLARLAREALSSEKN